MRRARFGCLLTLVVLGLVGYAFAVLPSVPWWALAFGVVFWVALARRRRAAGAPDGAVAAPVADDGPRWSPFHSRGF